MAICLVRGSINIDEFFHVPTIVRPGETLSSSRFERRAGGKGANQAVAVARAGMKVSLVGAVGTDGDWVLRSLGTLGVDTSRVLATNEEPTGRAIIQLTPEGENSIILHRGANYYVTPAIAQPNDQKYTHLLLQNEIPYEITLAYLSHSYRFKRTSFFNPSPLPTKDQIQIFPWEQLDWLIVNQGEALDLLKIIGLPGDFKPSAEADDRQETNIVASARSVLRALGVLALVPHLMDNGEDDIIYVPATRINPAEVRDTTGAGDCFAGYFVAGLMEIQVPAAAPGAQCSLTKEDVIKVLIRCVNAAGLCVQRPGAMESIPSKDEVQSRLCS